MRLVERYRPATLDDIVGQDQIVRSLKWLAARIKAGEATEHMMFLGPPGVGKTTAAMGMLQSLILNGLTQSRLTFYRPMEVPTDD